MYFEETSALTNTNVNDTFNKLLNMIYDVKSEIEKAENDPNRGFENKRYLKLNHEATDAK